MLYFVQTGEINVSTVAKTPKHAAIQAIRQSDKTPGECVIVSESEIREDYCEGNFYFLTDSIVENLPPMRIVY